MGSAFLRAAKPNLFCGSILVARDENVSVSEMPFPCQAASEGT